MLGEKAIELLRQLQRSGSSLSPFNEDGVRQTITEMKVLYEQNQKDVMFRKYNFSVYDRRKDHLRCRVPFSIVYIVMQNLENESYVFHTVHPRLMALLHQDKPLIAILLNRAAVREGNTKLFSSIHLRHATLERDKRCLLTYIYCRLQKIRDLRWAFGSILPQDIKYNLTEPEVQWFMSYSKTLANYMMNVGENFSLDLTQQLSPPKSLFIQVRCLTDYGEFETDDGETILLSKNTTHFLERSQCEHLIRQGILEHIIT